MAQMLVRPPRMGAVMQRRALLSLVIFLSFWKIPLHAADKPDRSVQDLTGVERRLDSIEAKLTNADVSSRLEKIDEDLTEMKHSSLLMTMLPSVLAAIAALAGIGVGALAQGRLQQARLDREEKAANKKAEQDRTLAEKQAKLQIGNAVVDWQLKQLSLLYGPVRALLGQSFGLYRQMNKLLEQAAPTRFRLLKVDNAQGQNAQHGEEFQIQTAAGWGRFRTVMHIEEVYGRDYGVETYFDEIVAIGARTVKIIEQNAGYARPEEKELMDVFAKYLAHFAVLEHLHGLARERLASSDPLLWLMSAFSTRTIGMIRMLR
jgi:hypothetical protein